MLHLVTGAVCPRQAGRVLYLDQGQSFNRTRLRIAEVEHILEVLVQYSVRTHAKLLLRPRVFAFPFCEQRTFSFDAAVLLL